ncbi:MAG: helix-turn-helix domain-containing protein [Actinobacteria bacterium]|jgi:cytoskeleton protein RodZ|nr:helix-turn-helix domain-containing protein [Actinomycetota bacterium]
MAEESALKIAIAASGMSIEKISDKTNIRTAVIEDLLNDSVEVCGGIAYARGHIRSIAKVIKADADLLVAAIESAQSGDKKLIIDQLAENNVADKKKEKKKLRFGTLASISAAVLGIGFVAQIAINNVSTVNESIVSNISQKPSTQSKESAVNNFAGVNLVLTAVAGNSWVGLTNANGDQIFNGQIYSGQSQTFNDAQLIKAVIGNAGAIKLQVNGSDLGLAGANGQVVRLDFGTNGLSQS